MYSKPTACILDDDTDFNWALKLILERAGFEVYQFSGPQDFFKFLGNQKAPDICFIDLNLRQANEGYSVLEFLRKSMNITTPIFVISSTCNTEAFHRALEKGATDYFVKPIERHVLMNKLSRFVSSDQIEFQSSTLIPDTCVGDRACLASELEISSIQEDGITMVGGHLLGKGISVTIDGELVKEITGSPAPHRVTLETTEVDLSTGGYKYFASFDPRDVDFLSAVRKWILKNKLGTLARE